MNSKWLPKLNPGLCTVGVLLGTLFLSVSLSPSLLPRPFAVQGVLSGLSFAFGYGLGVAGLVDDAEHPPAHELEGEEIP